MNPFWYKRALKLFTCLYYHITPVFGPKASDKNEEDEDDDDDDSGPSWDMQESMVRKLQKKFPDQDKEVNGTLFLPVIHQNVSNWHYCCPDWFTDYVK